MRDTGVRFKDIAGLTHILVEMQEVVKMLLNDPAYIVGIEVVVVCMSLFACL